MFDSIKYNWNVLKFDDTNDGISFGLVLYFEYTQQVPKLKCKPNPKPTNNDAQ